MKLFFSIIMCYLCSTIGAQVDMDSIKINYKAQGLKLSEVFSELEDEYGIRFSYATSSILEHPMDVSFTDKSMDEVLEYLLSDQQMDYKIMANNILVRKSSTYAEGVTESYQKSLHVKGRIIPTGDINTRGLEFATISISNTSIGTYTDLRGNFDIEIPTEHISEQLVIHALGYADQRYTITELEDKFLMIAMESQNFALDEITIVNRQKPIKFDDVNNSIALNTSLINSNTTGLVGNDLSRQLQLLPGVSAHDDASADIKLRGRNRDETMIIVDGLPLYHTSHYYGIFSSINTSYIDSVQIYKNNYPLPYDGKTGGVVELFSSKRQPSQSSANIELNLLTASADTTIPIAKSTMLSISGRSTIRNISNSQFNTFAPEPSILEQIGDFRNSKMNQSTNPQFNFFDINAKLQTRVRKKDLLSFNFYKSTDKLSNQYTRKQEDNNENRLSLIASEEGHWDNTAAGISYQMLITPSTKWNTQTYYTRYENELTNDYSIEAKVKENNQGPSNNKNSTLLSSQSNHLQDVGLDSHLSHTRGTHTFQLGLSAVQHEIQYTINENNHDRLEGGKTFYETAAYIGYKGKLTDRLALNTGIRTSHFDINMGNYISPRVLLSYTFSDVLSAKSSYGYYQQLIRELNYEYRGEPLSIWVNAEENSIPVLSTHNLMIGTTIKLENISIDLEAYRKNMTGVIEQAVIDPGNGSSSTDSSRDYILFEGDGFTQGIDVLISSGYKNYESHIAYTLSQSQQRFEEISQYEYFASEDDRRHQLKWFNSYKAGNITWGFNTIYISGRRYTDIENLGPLGNITSSKANQRFKRLPAYRRLDLSASYDFTFSRFNSSLALSLFNVLNTENVKYVQSVSTTIEENQTPINTVIGSNSNLLGRTINLSWRVGF